MILLLPQSVVEINLDSLKLSSIYLRSALGAICKVRTPQNGHFWTPHQPLYSKIRFGLTPTPPLYKHILVTHFQSTMNVKNSRT